MKLWNRLSSNEKITEAVNITGRLTGYGLEYSDINLINFSMLYS